MTTLKELRKLVKEKGLPYTTLNREEMENFLSMKKYSLGWRWSYIYPHIMKKKEGNEVVNMLLSPVRNIKKLRSATEQRKINRFLNEHKVIITMTTSPTRLPKIVATLATLDLTYVKNINVVLPEEYGHKKEKYETIPKELIKFPKVKIIRIKRDLGPITKMLPTITRMHDKNSLVISIDDDVAYPMGMVNELIYQRVIKHKKSVISMGTMMPFFSSVEGMRKGWPQRKSRLPYADIVEGWSSILYSPNIVNSNCMKKLASLSKQCLLSDDFVISYVLSLNKVKKVLIDNKYAYNPMPYNYGALEDALHAGRGLGEKKKFVAHSDDINFEKYGECLKAIENYVARVKRIKVAADPCGFRSKRK